MAKNEETKEEGTRSFSRAFEMLGDGAAQRRASDELHDLTKYLRDEARYRGQSVSGEIDVKIKMRMDEDGTAVVTYDVKVKKPAPKVERTILWTTSGGNLTPENPRQQKLPLRDVSAPESAGAREIEEGGKFAAREV